ncbi:MAG: T9SS C-terminal target domain-containing protein, partial [Crocinitomicaceae bacterium]|nr:T9SS C-terminal target domain-containing protein [Crocinitomicaceae bacterium]
INQIFQGPVSADYSNYLYQGRWFNKIWKLSRTDIDLFRAHWLCEQGLTVNGCDNLPAISPGVLNTIYSWPANGDTILNESAQLAPYFDRNSNGKYEPHLGDYPIIKGMSAVYVIQNDDAGSYFQTTPTRRMGIEIHTMYYQFGALDEINDATFIDVTVFNRSNRDYHDFILGNLVDGDLGNYADDYFACDTTCNLICFYNGDEYDESDGGRIGYGEFPPAFGFKSFNHKMNSSFRFVSTSAWNGDTTSTGVEPYTLKEMHWFRLNGLNSYGQPYLHPNGNPTKFQYSGNPSNPTEWSEISANNPPGDRRGYFTTEPTDLLSGQQLVYSYGLVYERSGDRLQNVAELMNNCSFYQEAYDTDFEAYYEAPEYNLTVETINLTTFPNPVVEGTILNFANPNNENLRMQIVDISGNVIQTINNITSQSVELNRSNLKNGIYFIELRKQQVLIAKGKVIII